MLLILFILLSIAGIGTGIWFVKTGEDKDEKNIGIVIIWIVSIVLFFTLCTTGNMYHEEIEWQEQYTTTVAKIPLYEEQEQIAQALLDNYALKYAKIDVDIFGNIGPSEGKSKAGGLAGLNMHAAKYPEMKHNETLKGLLDNLRKQINFKLICHTRIEDIKQSLRTARRSLWRIFHPKKRNWE